MIFPFIKKDLLVMIRNRQELLVLLLMPIVLIAILGFALGGVLKGDSPNIHAKVAIINNDNEQEDLQLFLKDIENAGLPTEAETSMMIGAKSLLPVTILTEDVFGSEELKKYFEVKIIEPEQAEKVKKDDNYTAIIEIPEKFTYHLLSKVFLDKSADISFQLYKNEGKQGTSNLVEDVIRQFQKQLTTMTIVGKNGVQLDTEKIPGTIETVSKKEPINSMQYYTVGMSVMFIMYVASNISSFAYREKQLHVFNRIILSNTSRWSYFIGIFFSTMLIAFIQQLILYGVSALIFHVYWGDLAAFLVLNLSLSFAIGGVAALLTAVNYRIDSESASGFFSSILVTLFSLLGGSFTPLAEVSPIIEFIGNLTPNGAGMTALLKVLQGSGITGIFEQVLYLIIFGIVLLSVAAFSFPKRGEAI